MRKKLLSKVLPLLTLVFAGAASAWADVEILDFAAQGYENAQQITETAGNVVKATFTNGGTTTAYYNTGTAVRVYNGGTMTISAGENLITQVVYTYELNGTATVSIAGKTNAGSYDDANKTWTGSDKEVVLTAGTAKHVRVSKVEVTYTSGGDTPGDTKLDSNLQLTGTTNALEFDLYNNASAQEIPFETSSTGEITFSGMGNYVSVERSVTNQAIVVTPLAVTPGAVTIYSKSSCR